MPMTTYRVVSEWRVLLPGATGEPRRAGNLLVCDMVRSPSRNKVGLIDAQTASPTAASGGCRRKWALLHHIILVQNGYVFCAERKKVDRISGTSETQGSSSIIL